MFTVNPRLTEAGLALFKSTSPGAVVVTAIAIGNANYDPTGKETALKNEIARFPITSSTDTSPTSIYLGTTVTDIDPQNRPTGDRWIGEMGFYAGTTLLAVMSMQSRRLFYKTPGMDVPLDYSIDFSTVLPPGSLTIGAPKMSADIQLAAQTAQVEAASARAAAATASGQIGTAVTSAQQATLARDQAVEAWRAATAPNESLASIIKALHTGAVVDVFLYDTSRDSDGGEWRKRCKHTSWETEALVPGKFVGVFSGAGAAIAGGAVAGDYFQYSGDGGFLQLDSVSPSVSYHYVYRGNTREFPALALIVLESARMVIYDATRSELPMWLVCANGGNVIRGAGYVCLSALNGKVFAGAASQALSIIDFPADTMEVADAGGYYRFPASVAKRNNPITAVKNPAMVGLINSQTLRIALAVLPDAPIDPASGLPVPTSAIATTGGVSIIRHDKTIVHWLTIVGGISGISIDKSGRLCAAGGEGVSYKSWFRNGIPSISVDNTVDGLYYSESIPRRPGTDGSTGRINLIEQTKSYTAFGSSSNNNPVPLHLYKYNPETPAKSMVAFVSNAFVSGWQVGDVRGAWLADTVAEVASGGELVTNGAFDVNANGWTALGEAILTWSSGQLTVANRAAGGMGGAASQPIATIPGAAYRVTVDFIKSGTASGNIGASSSQGLDDLGRAVATASGRIEFTFIATAAVTYVMMYANSATASISGSYDNFSVRRVDPDRSAKNKGLVINGSITKAPVAAGSQLVAYSGFSATNYLEQPYNSDLDLGTSDFCVMGWAYDGTGYLFERGRVPNATGDMALFIQSDGALRFIYQNVSFVNSGVTLMAGAKYLLGYMRSGGKGYFIVNDRLINVDIGVTANVTASGAKVTIGSNSVHDSPFTGSMALWRVGATAPSADQIAQIYRDELALFQPGAQCTIDGAKAPVTALAYDDMADLLHVGTSWGRSAFKGLQRIESVATTVGAITSLSAAGGAHITGASNGARYHQPALLLRDELRRKNEARRALGALPVPLWRDGGAAGYQLPVGFDVHAVYRQGLLQREGAANDYTASFDGYRWTVTFPATVPANTNICIMGVRNGTN